MSEILQTDTGNVMQKRLVRALVDRMRNAAGAGNVRLVETHISWVLLTGRYAYKIKKSVNFGFLNFSSLEARRYFCEEEIRLNRRLAPKIYLNVVSIGGSIENPVLGGLPAIEYAVRMRRFTVFKQLDRLALRNKILPQHIDSLAANIARFHANLPVVVASSSFGTAASVSLAAAQNYEQLKVLFTEKGDLDRLGALQRASEIEFSACRNLFERRLELGCVRECHGDLHLGNIVMVGEQPVPFDGIEFNPALRWIDVMSEIAFTVMDLMHYQRPGLAFRFLNAYLEVTGDFDGVAVLRFYLAYRATVRAKVNAILAKQSDQSAAVMAQTWADCRGYLDLAFNCLTPVRPVLIITHGLPGSGKTTFSQVALERWQAIRLRSDVERKRLFGLDALADSRISPGIDLYRADISRRTYTRLCELARSLLQAGYSVIVDAAFLQQDERERFRKLAGELSAPFAIASIQARKEILNARIRQRQIAARDASEADGAVLDKLLLTQQTLTPYEQVLAAYFVNDDSGFAADSTAWASLAQLLSRLEGDSK